MFIEEEMKMIRGRTAGDLKRFRKAGFDNDTARRLANDGFGVPVKPTPENLIKLARENINFANRPSYPKGDEYYSRCGAEDGVYYAKLEAKEEAKRLIAAAKRVKGGR